MSKARDLADFVSAGSPLADGTISVSEVSGAAPTASPSFTGNVGVGTSSPQRPLHVDGVEGVARFTSTASGNNGFEVGIGASSQAFLWQSENAYMQFATNATERMRIDSIGNVGIGTSTVPSGSSATSRFITVAGSGDGVLQLTKNGSGGGAIASASGTGMLFYTHTGTVGSETYSERMRIDSSGNLLVDTTSTSIVGSGGLAAKPQGSGVRLDISNSGGATMLLDRRTNDGDIISFYKDGTTVGSIGASAGDIFIGTGDTGIRFKDDTDDIRPWNTSTNALTDGTIDIGDSIARFKDLYLSGGVVENTTTVTYASSIGLTYDNGSIQTVTLTGNVTFTDSLADGEAVVLMLNAGASHTVTWPTMTWVSSGGNAAPTLTANDTLVFWKIGSTLYGAYAGSYT